MKMQGVPPWPSLFQSLKLRGKRKVNASWEKLTQMRNKFVKKMKKGSSVMGVGLISCRVIKQPISDGLFVVSFIGLKFSIGVCDINPT